MKLQTAIERTSVRFVALLLTGLSAWCVLKCLEWVGFYSSWAGDPGMESALSHAHLWAVSYALGAVLLGSGATVLIASSARKSDDGLASTRYLLEAFAVTASISICVVLAILYSAAFHHRLGIVHP